MSYIEELESLYKYQITTGIFSIGSLCVTFGIFF